MTSAVCVELDELIALQALVSRSSFQPKARMQFQGNRLSRFRGRGMEFAEVRNYQAGDDIRHMEWRVTARTGRAHVKVYEEERDQVLMIVTDFSPSMFFGTRHAFKSVTAARLSALLAWTAMHHGDKVGAFLYSYAQRVEFTPQARKAAVLPLLASLSVYSKQGLLGSDTAQSNIRIDDELLRLRRVVKPGSKIAIISDFYHLTQEGINHLTRLAAHNDIIFYCVCDSLELAPPPPGIYPISNGLQTSLLITENGKMEQAYQSWCNDRQQRLAAECRRLSIRYVQVRAEDSLGHLLRQTAFWRPRG